jgi:hypothetical protein
LVRYRDYCSFHQVSGRCIEERRLVDGVTALATYYISKNSSGIVVLES